MAEKFENLKVWQLSHELVLKVYSLTAGFPAEEKYGLASQLRRSAASIPANVVEGCSRRSDKGFGYFLDVARGSCTETIYHLVLAKDLSFIDENHYEELRKGYEEVSRMLNGLASSLHKGEWST